MAFKTAQHGRLRTLMNGFSTTTIQGPRNSGRSRRLPTLLLSTAAFTFVALFGLRAHMVRAEDAPSLSETSLLPEDPSQASDRETRLRDIEDQLLKQLSMGATPSAQESTPTPLPNIKHVATSETTAAMPTPEQPKRQAPAPIATTAPSTIKRPRIMQAVLPEPSTTDEVRVADARNPESTTTVPVSAKSVPHRTPKIKRTSSSEHLTAKDLEHRLAITESQLTLLTKELETTKAKLAQSESQVLDLTQKLEEGGASRPSQSVQPESASAQQISAPKVSALSADDTDGVDTRADSYATVARVTKNNVPLRIGPGSRESTILKVSRNSIVTIEHRTGDWYRIIMTDGTRGWINGSALIFNEGVRAGSTVRVGAFETRLETMGLDY
jgi:Bacterial SH3 domain